MDNANDFAVVFGLALYFMMSGFLLYTGWRVLGAPQLPDWMINFYYWKWTGTVQGFFTVRYESDEHGLWQIIEQFKTGYRYRVQVYDSEGNYKW